MFKLPFKLIFYSALTGLFLATAQTAASQTAQHCVSYDDTSGTLANRCDYDVEAFICAASDCGGPRYYGQWQHVKAVQSQKLRFPLEGDVEFGACPGTYFTAEHTANADYTCLTPHNAAMQISPPDVPIVVVSVSESWACSDVISVPYTLSRLGPEAIKLRTHDGKLATFNAHNTVHDITKQPYIDPEAIHDFICSDFKEISFTERAAGELNRVLKALSADSVKANPTYRRELAPCLCVRG